MLEASGIHAYYGDSHVLQGIDISVAAGECVAILGRNGAGKTTTLRAIMGYLPIRKGAIKFHGKEIHGTPTHGRARAGLSLVPEDRGIFASVSVDHHLRMARLGARARSPLPAHEVYRLFPRLEKRQTALGGELSGGEQQMLAVGRAIMTRPDVLILDEPSEGLAPVIVEVLRDALLAQKRKGTPLLLVEQNYKLALAIADKVYILNQGRVVYAGTMRDLDADEAARHKYLALAK
jgi:branched-chain amino acid transport system ATP-binding protein